MNRDTNLIWESYIKDDKGQYIFDVADDPTVSDEFFRSLKSFKLIFKANFDQGPAISGTRVLDDDETGPHFTGIAGSSEVFQHLLSTQPDITIKLIDSKKHKELHTVAFSQVDFVPGVGFIKRVYCIEMYDQDEDKMFDVYRLPTNTSVFGSAGKVIDKIKQFWNSTFEHQSRSQLPPPPTQPDPNDPSNDPNQDMY